MLAVVVVSVGWLSWLRVYGSTLAGISFPTALACSLRVPGTWTPQDRTRLADEIRAMAATAAWSCREYPRSPSWARSIGWLRSCRPARGRRPRWSSTAAVSPCTLGAAHTLETRMGTRRARSPPSTKPWRPIQRCWTPGTTAVSSSARSAGARKRAAAGHVLLPSPPLGRSSATSAEHWLPPGRCWTPALVDPVGTGQEGARAWLRAAARASVDWATLATGVDAPPLWQWSSLGSFVCSSQRQPSHSGRGPTGGFCGLVSMAFARV